MTSSREFSPQTLSILAALYEQPTRWQHGYALASQTGLKSGTLYPILIRLADRGLVEASWQEEPQPGRPRRHLYRLTADGLASAAGALAGASEALAAAPARQSGRQGAGRSSRQAAGQPSQRGAGQPGRRGAAQPIGPGAAAPAVR